MKLTINKTIAGAFLPIALASSFLSAARKDSGENCAPPPPATCYPDDCCRTYCLGPNNDAINAPVRPFTCNGDWAITVAGFYWNAHQDGMEYAILTEVIPDIPNTQVTLVDSNYKNPNFGWDFGFKLGLGYNTTCDGWDFGIVWTRYRGKASSHDEAELEDNITLLPFWSDFGEVAESALGSITMTPFPLFATDISTNWRLDLNLIDIELGREFWSGKRVTLRPFIGLRIAFIKQSFTIEHRGGSFFIPVISALDLEIPVNDFVDLDNNYKGVGIRSGFNSIWNVGCGWGIYGETAFSILYGRFNVEHSEKIKQSTATPLDPRNPNSEEKILDSKDSFRASRLVIDLSLGVQWSALFCDCDYGFTVQLGWENHLFLEQNQLWRVYKISAVNASGSSLSPNLINNFSQTRGTLDTQGWTLTVKLDF